MRGVRLLTPGVGVGLVLLFTATVVRVWVPRTPVWLVIAAGTAAAFFADEREVHIDEVDIDEADTGTLDIDDAEAGEPILADVDEAALVGVDSSTLGDKSAD